jgi:hypothetical protein
MTQFMVDFVVIVAAMLIAAPYEQLALAKRFNPETRSRR